MSVAVGSTEETALQAALALASRRALSEAELRERLRLRAFSDEDAAPAVAKMLSYGYIDDAALAERERQRAVDQHRGPGWLRACLERRGLCPGLIDGVCEQLDGQQPALALAAARDRFGSPEKLHGRLRQQAWRHLVGRGFEPDIIGALLGAADDEANEDSWTS